MGNPKEGSKGPTKGLKAHNTKPIKAKAGKVKAESTEKLVNT